MTQARQHRCGFTLAGNPLEATSTAISPADHSGRCPLPPGPLPPTVEAKLAERLWCKVKCARFDVATVFLVDMVTLRTAWQVNREKKKRPYSYRQAQAWACCRIHRGGRPGSWWKRCCCRWQAAQTQTSRALNRRDEGAVRGARLVAVKNREMSNETWLWLLSCLSRR